MSAIPEEAAGRSGRSDHRREVIVVDPRPLLAKAVVDGFDGAQWRVQVVDPDELGDIPIRSGIGLVALATPHVADVVALLVGRDRRVAVYGSDDGAAFFEAVDAGAVGFVSDRSDTAEFCQVAESLRGGAVTVFPEHTRRRLFERDWPAADAALAGLGRLTRREREVLRGLVAGLRPAEIAERDFVSVTTVRNQVQSVLTKLNAHSQLEAVAAAHRHGSILDIA